MAKPTNFCEKWQNMIKYIRFNNFYSYLDDTEISFEVSKQATSSAYDFSLETAQDTYRLNKVMAVLGANGSGKTQLLKPLAFIDWLLILSASFDGHKGNLVEPFALNQSNETLFELGFFAENEQGKLEEYRYELALRKEKIIGEALYIKSSSQFSYIFKCSYNEGKINYKHKGFLHSKIANNIPKQTSMISYAYHQDNPIALQVVYAISRLTTNITSVGRINLSNHIFAVSELFLENPNLKTLAEQLLTKFDTGIKRIEIKTVTHFDENNQMQEILMPFGIHQMADGTEFELNFFQESNGTQSAYNLLGLILPVLNGGGIAVIDELDNDLHPLLLPEILNLFRSSHTNPHNAQLIFTCHTPEVFNLLNKHQIYLVEKTDQLSETWRLDEMDGVRNDDNLYAKYMAGAFSAVPNL